MKNLKLNTILDVDCFPNNYLKRIFGNTNFWCIWMSTFASLVCLATMPYFDIRTQICVWINVFAIIINVLAFSLDFLFVGK